MVAFPVPLSETQKGPVVPNDMPQGLIRSGSAGIAPIANWSETSAFTVTLSALVAAVARRATRDKIDVLKKPRMRLFPPGGPDPACNSGPAFEDDHDESSEEKSHAPSPGKQELNKNI